MKDIKNAFEESNQTTIKSFGRHKTGNNCSITMPNSLFNEIKRFGKRLIEEQAATDETPVQI